MSCRTQGWISRRPEADLKLGWQDLAQKSRFEVWGAGLRPRGQIWGLKVWFEAWRADLRSGGLICGLEGIYEVRRADLSSQGLNWGLKGLIWWLRGPKSGLRLQNWGFDGQGGGRKDGRTEGRTSRNSPLCPTGHRPFWAAAQKARLNMYNYKHYGTLLPNEWCKHKKIGDVWELHWISELMAQTALL